MKLFYLAILMIIYGSSLHASGLNQAPNPIIKNEPRALQERTNADKGTLIQKNTNDLYQRWPTEKCGLIKRKINGNVVLCI